MTKKDYQVLMHIDKYCDRINDTVIRYGNDYNTFYNDLDYFDSIGMKILQIGELTTNLSDDFRSSNTDIEWHQIKRMRNVYAHEYGKIDYERVWYTINTKIPELSSFCKNSIDEYEQNIEVDEILSLSEPEDDIEM